MSLSRHLFSGWYFSHCSHACYFVNPLLRIRAVYGKTGRALLAKKHYDAIHHSCAALAQSDEGAVANLMMLKLIVILIA
ncbi:hypothetical protein [Bartonella sp. AU55XJBT]|uniref:hypothetical protein n=1 Tax=Bartonella sp. AU55XJBT TaxID=3019091 RepID=UPI0023617A22|nr:hypothetical protein [Bartonella sp. AU55XJBT]